MSTAPPTNSYPPPAPAAIRPAVTRGPREIKLVSHSPIFYWWPIWVLGFLLAFITYLDGTRLAILPSGARVVQVTKEEKQSTYQIEAPNPTTHSLADAQAAAAGAQGFRTKVSERPWMGPLFCMVVLVTIVITNVPLRGLWSFLVILMFVILALVFSVFGLWDDLLKAVGDLHIYMNMSAYLFFAVAVLLLWLVSVFIFDQRTYMIVTPGQIQVCEHIGASVKNFPAGTVTFEKQRDDLFRHWILGFFSGDLIIHVRDKEQIRLPNVLWIGWRLEEVQQVLREVAVVNETR